MLGQERFAEAEPLLPEAYNGLRDRAGKIPANLRAGHLTSAKKWLTDLYEAWNKPDDEKKWRDTAKSHLPQV